MSSLPALDSVADQQRARELRFHKARATGLLLLATIVYIFMILVFPDGDGWAGYVEAAAEASMVGGLADWFAVTALFKHPLGLPIPHTAIVPKRKDEIGEALGEFVQENFLQPEVLTDRIAQANVADKIGDWLSRPGNAQRVADQAGAVVAGIVEVLQDEEIQESLDGLIRRRAETLDLAPVLGRVVDFAVSGNHHHTVFDASLRGVEGMLDENRGIMRNQLDRESPWWVPETLDDRVFEKIYSGIQNFISEINRDPNHEVRSRVDTRIRKLATDLRESPELAERAEEIKRELLDHPEAREWSDSLWRNIKSELLSAADNPDSELRHRIASAAAQAGDRLQADPDLRRKVDEWVATLASHLVSESRGEVAELISSTVKKWDAEDTSRRFEIQIGRDLQFIRINGTLVGGIAGLVIHAISDLLL